jgi:hypothetical protein
MPKVATGASLQRSLTVEMMVSSDFSFSIWNFQQPSKFGHTLNNRAMERVQREIRLAFVVPFHQLNAKSSKQSRHSKEFHDGDDGSLRFQFQHLELSTT